MRFRNLSSLDIDRDLWRALARPFGMDRALPGAIADNLGLYVGKSLRVTIRPQLEREPEHPSGWCSYGHISLFPCPICTPAFLTCVYLHELFHAWLHEVDDDLYLTWRHCEAADRFADTAFELLGGIVAQKCGGYRAGRGSRHLQGYESYVGTLESRRGNEIKHWNAKREAERLTRFCS